LKKVVIYKPDFVLMYQQNLAFSFLEHFKLMQEK